MRHCVFALLCGCSFLALGRAQTAPLSAKDTAAIVEFIQKAVPRALDYKQGDHASLIDAQGDFTADGWREFMKYLEGWLDGKGAPLGSSSFAPNGDAVVKGQDNGVVHLTIPGTLKQTQNTSRTTYRVSVDVQVSGKPLKILHLETIICIGASTASACH